MSAGTIPVCRHTGLGVPECCCRPCTKRLQRQHRPLVSWCANELPPPGVEPHLAQEPDSCHCGSPMRGSDHCPSCGCEEYERYCNFVYQPNH